MRLSGFLDSVPDWSFTNYPRTRSVGCHHVYLETRVIESALHLIPQKKLEMQPLLSSYGPNLEPSLIEDLHRLRYFYTFIV